MADAPSKKEELEEGVFIFRLAIGMVATLIFLGLVAFAVVTMA